MGRTATSNLVPFNSKVDPEVREMYNALVATRADGSASVHELLKVILKLYEEANPQAFEKARQYIKLMNDRPDEPLEQ